MKGSVRRVHWGDRRGGKPEGGDGVVSPCWNRQRTSSRSASSGKKIRWPGGAIEGENRGERTGRRGGFIGVLGMEEG
jgi:hypothetical protein